MSDGQLTLMSPDPALELDELVDGEPAEASADPPAALLSPPPTPGPPGLEARNLFAEADRIAARAASASTRQQYAAIYRSFGDWLAANLGRPPLVGDLDADVIAAYGRHLAVCGGRAGQPAAASTARVYLSMVRALARALDRDDAAAVRIPRHLPGPPETLTDTDYHNLLRVLGDCGLRSAELRSLRARDLRRPRSNARHHRLYVHGKGGREREVPVPLDVQAALEAWTAVHPLARGVALLDEHPPVRPPRPPRARSASPPLCRRRAPPRPPPLPRRRRPGPPRAPPRPTRLLGHPLPRGRRPRPRSQRRLGHADLRTTARYAAARPERIDEIADVLDRRHQAARRAGRGT